MITKLTGLTVPASPLGTLVRTLDGMPLNNMLRYYTLLDGGVGSTPIRFVDASGNAPAAEPITGAATVTRTAAGLSVPDGPGFAFDTGVSMAGSRSIVIATRDLSAPQDEQNGWFTMFAGPADRIVTPMTADQSNNGPGPYILSRAYPSAQLGHRRAYSGAGSLFASASNVKQIATNDEDFGNWKVAALSWDVETDVIRFAMHDAANSSETTETDFIAEIVSSAATLAFGAWHNANLSVEAELGLFAAYDVAKSVAELQELCAQAAAVMVGRGQTVPG